MMEHHNIIQRTIPPTTTAGMDHSEELLAEVDEPPDERKSRSTWAPPKLTAYPSFNKADPSFYQRRESLLTRQLHSEAEQTDEEVSSRAPPRTLSTQSTWSNPSTASTAELTSDDGHSVASPFHSPPLPATVISTAIPAIEKPLNKEPKIAEHDNKLAETGSEKSVEEGLGRKRCISFACGGNKDKKPPTSQPIPAAPKVDAAEPSSPPKRKCALKFVCPTRAAVESRPTLQKRTSSRRLASPPPPERRSKDAPKVHRGSDSTVTHASPRSVRKSPVILETAPIATTSAAAPAHRRKLSNDSDNSTEALRFHEFASSDGEPEEWVQESTCYKSRLTVNDTLQKEITIRKACEEVEEEALEEEDEDEDDAEDEDADEDDAEDEEDDDDIELESESDDGFRTDDEEGFAESDSEGEESDEDWWRPGGRSTAATSTDHLDQLAKMKLNDTTLASSIGSVSSSHMSPRNLLRKHRKTPANAVPIQLRPEPIDLPDSTDFVCGTLDEDRPLEQAFLNHKKEREAAKHKARPQDIDPTFPTSDPEMDEEDDDDLEDAEESEHESLMHGGLEDLDGESTLRRRPSNRGRRPSHVHRSPPPPARRRSPAPAAMKRTTTARSPPPPVRRSTARSPPPTVRRTTTGRSPAPRKLFANSPKRVHSPAPKVSKMTSPPNTQRSSPLSFGLEANVLASRPQLTHTASLPRNGGYTLGKFNGYRMDDGEETETGNHIRACDRHKRGAIDIYKGLEKKRQRRKEKHHAKMCAKAAAKGEKSYKVKPGKGAERMRELGLELQRYRGKGEHILSA